MSWFALVWALAQSPGLPTSMNLNEQAIIAYDEGVRLGSFRASRINCTGTGVTCTQTGTTMTLNASGGGGSAYNLIEDEGTPLTARTTLDFTGAGVSCADSGGKTVCTIAGGGGGGVDNWPLTSFGGGF